MANDWPTFEERDVRLEAQRRRDARAFTRGGTAAPIAKTDFDGSHLREGESYQDGQLVHDLVHRPTATEQQACDENWEGRGKQTEPPAWWPRNPFVGEDAWVAPAWERAEADILAALRVRLEQAAREMCCFCEGGNEPRKTAEGRIHGRVVLCTAAPIWDLIEELPE